MRHFSISRKRAAGAIIVTAAMLILTLLGAAGGGADRTCLLTALLLSAAGGVFVLLPLEFGGLLSLLMMLILPFCALCSLEYYTHVPQDLTWKILLLNLLFFWILYALFIFLAGSVRTGGILATLVPMLFGLANYFVVRFRSHPIVPWDFLSIRTALSVSDSYSFTFEWRAVFVLFAFLWIMLLFSKSRIRFSRLRLRIPAAALSAALMMTYIGAIQQTAVQDFFGMDSVLFTLNVLYRNNGIAAAFLGNLRFLQIGEPEGYSQEQVAQIEEQALSNGQDQAEGTSPDQYPNVIVIMDEAFSDLSVWGDFATSEEVMPFFSSLQEKSVGGELYVSVKGGNTANTEYELLTGDTMGFLPAGSIPYQQYIHEEMPGLVSYLGSLGYHTLALHPYNRSGWDRDKVYEDFGFDEFLGIESFPNPEKYRGYVSDRAAFHKIIQEYQQKEDGERLFVFEVTMQNHGGYSRATPDFDAYVTLPEVSSKTTSVLATEKYLTLMNMTDRALEELVSYFESEEEPVILLMLGDHQPSDYITNVVQRITGTQTGESLEESQTGYRVPFVIWSNFGTDSAQYDGISVNYLGGLLMRCAGIPLTGYQQFLMALMEKLPVISGNLYRDASGEFHDYASGAYAQELDEYRILQYNHLMDSGHRDDSFFG